ncbi:MAG TPA: hypothetical protein VF281_02715 [Candidatus Saccharimonadales bacterium]
MKQVLIITTTLLIGAMLFDGLYYPNSPLMWLASTDTVYAYVRLGLMICLLGLLVFRPPRLFYNRVFLGVLAGGLAAITCVLVGEYTIEFLDAIIFIEVAIIFMIEALETDQLTLRQLEAKSTLLGQA